MTVPDFLLHLAAGRLLVWLLQTNGLMKPIWKRSHTLTELGDCDLCLGFWVYLALGIFSRPALTLPRPIGWVILAAISTFGMHLIRLGWKERFGMEVLN